MVLFCIIKERARRHPSTAKEELRCYLHLFHADSFVQKVAPFAIFEVRCAVWSALLIAWKKGSVLSVCGWRR